MESIMKSSAYCPHTKLCNFYQSIIDDIDIENSNGLENEYFKVYCAGPLHESCYRYCYMQIHGKQPAELCTPTGLRSDHPKSDKKAK